jgi:hypothetical protein
MTTTPATGTQVWINLSDAGWLKGTVTSYASLMEVVVKTDRGGTYNVVSVDSPRLSLTDPRR